jgi:hypothetical protein
LYPALQGTARDAMYFAINDNLKNGFHCWPGYSIPGICLGMRNKQVSGIECA